MGVAMKKVFKYILILRSVRQQVLMPKGAKILHVGEQNRAITIWALVDTEAELLHREFIIMGTGQNIPYDKYTHVGTVLEGVFVWHVVAVE